VVKNDEFLQEIGSLSPENPVLKLQLLSHTTYEYSEKVLVERNIQEYRLRPGLVALGLLGAGLSFYAANTDVISTSKNSVKKVTFSTAGGLLALSGFLSMKPVGEPRKTGEERYLRKTGAALITDTLKVTQTGDRNVSIRLLYGDTVIYDEQDRPIHSGLLEINLANHLNALNIRGSNPAPVHLKVQYQDSLYQFSYPLRRILHPYARITAPVAELRNAPIETNESVLAELLRGSQLKIVDIKDPEWYRVLYGISENFIHKNNADMIWRSTEFARDSQIFAIPTIPFGSIDVETNIPILSKKKKHAAALIITNQTYQDSLPTRTYTHRDGQLIRSYLENTLGYPESNIFHIKDLKDVHELSKPLSSIDSIATDRSELFIFISAYGSIKATGNTIELGLIPAGRHKDSNFDEIPLKALFRRIASIPSQKTVLLADIEFNHELSQEDVNARNLMMRRPLRNLSEIITNYNPRSVILFGSSIEQNSAVYLSNSGEDKKHRIFPYFFARALQERRTNMAEIYQFLERNVSYHARRLHDHPQDPQLFGRITLDLVSENQ
jgi:hypothetical protein